MKTTKSYTALDVSAFVEKARSVVRSSQKSSSLPVFDLSAFACRANSMISSTYLRDHRTSLSPVLVTEPLATSMAIVPAQTSSPLMKPLYKWQGGKTKLLKAYRPLLPAADSFTSYVEPFFGAGALFCHMRNTYPRKPSLINDINPYVVNVLRVIKELPALFRSQLQALEQAYLSICSKGERSKFYYETRSQYWLLEDDRSQFPSSSKAKVLCAAYLYFLMKTGFNGLWQPMRSRNDYFGTAFGLGNEKPGFIDYALIREWHEHLQDTEISCCSYEELNIPTDSFVFCDPPYLDNTVSYGTKRVDTVSLLGWCEQLQRQGATVWLANRDVETSFYEDFSAYDQKTIFDVCYTGGKKAVNSKKEVLLIWNKRNISMAA